MGTPYEFLCSDLPTMNAAMLNAMQQLIQQVLALNTITPLNNVALTMNDEGTHLFQVVTADARVWLDVLTAVAPYTEVAPGLTRHPQSSVSTWNYFEWTAIDAIRLALFNFHVALGHPALIQILLGVSGVAVLVALPVTAAAGAPNAFTVSYYYAAAGHADWIGMFKVGDPNTSYGQYHTVPDLQTSGSFTFDAPAIAGSYEFRYLPVGGFQDVGRSGHVSVTP